MGCELAGLGDQCVPEAAVTLGDLDSFVEAATVRRERLAGPGSLEGANASDGSSIATCGRAAMLRECLASGPDTQKNSLHSAGAHQTGETKGRGRPPRRRCRWL
jgi:hypothetical protein